ncbi:MAG: response regulator transcription factor [Victivallales bacterium]|jgi:two-component system phosphate regulon response regulator PhoB|nr:response regulator transcription factor [Victivallales bacterium]
MPDNKILIVEDENSIRELITHTLKSAGFSSLYEAPNGEFALSLAKRVKPNLILLDLMLPGVNGLDICRTLKADEELCRIPVIMLTAKSSESDIVLGLEMGASDYITKPFSINVLIARVRTQLRGVAQREKSEVICYGNLAVNSATRSAVLNGVELALTCGEFDILLLFAAHPGRVYTRNQIIAKIKGDDYVVTERAIDVQILNLRRKLGEWSVNIETIRGVGYRLKTGDYL